MMLTTRVSNLGGINRMLLQQQWYYAMAQQRRHSQQQFLLSYHLHLCYSSTLQTNQGGLNSKCSSNKCPRQIYVPLFHQRKNISQFIYIPPLYRSRTNPSILHRERIPCIPKCFSNNATELSSIMMTNTSTAQNNTDNDTAVTTSASIPSSRTSSNEAGESSHVIGTQSKRRRRKRRKLSSTYNNLFSTTSTTPETAAANSKFTIMKVMKRRRRRPQQLSTATKTSSKDPKRLVYTDPQSTWNINLRKIQKFVQRQQQRHQPTKKSLNIRHMLPKDKSLRRWLRYLRCEYQKMLRGRKNKLSVARLEILRNCGVSFLIAPILVSWDERYNQLLHFLKKYDGKYPHELKSTLNSDELDLYHWCNRQRILRKAYIAKKLSKTMHINEERIARLDEINFLWSVNNLNWQERYDELKEYYKAYGNCMVPARWVGNRPLARWVETQRRQYTLMKQNKPSQLTPERIALLDELEFEWDPYEERWLERYNELIEFQRLNGDFVLPTFKTGRALYRWITQQQKAYHIWMAGKTSTMNEQRRDRLESRGVDWVLPKPKKKKDPLSKAHQKFKDMTRNDV